MLVGGKFQDVTNGGQTINQPWIAAFDAGTGQFLPWWRPQSGGAVLALETVGDGGVYVGGEMGTWNGVQRGALMKIDPETGDAWPGFDTRVYGGSSVVRDIRLEPDGWLYVVGNFTTASDGGNPQAVGGAIRMNPTTGAIDWNWLPDANDGAVWGVSVSKTNNEVYLAGWFRDVDGVSNTDGFAAVSNTTGAVLRGRSTIPYNTCVGCSNFYRLYDVVATTQGQIWVGGEQHALFILDESDLSMDLMHFTGCDLDQQADCNRRGGEYQEIEQVGNRIYAAGHFWGSHLTDDETIFFDSQFPDGDKTGSVSAVAAYNVNTGERIQSFNPYMSGNAGGFGMAVASDGCLWLTGGISQVGPIGNQDPARDLVRVCDTGGAGPDPQPNPSPPAPVSCTTSANGTEITVNWTVPAFATDVVIRRSVNSGNTAWRGRVSAPGAQFVENGVDNAVNEYFVQAKYQTNVLSALTPCQPPIDLTDAPVDDVAAPATCAATNDGVNATISWAASAGADDYRVYRSIDGGTFFWRGRVTTLSLDDTLRPTGSHQYRVQARGESGVWSDFTNCSPALDPAGGGTGDAPQPATCTASNSDVDATISWDASPTAVDYRVYRSIDGGTFFWRGRVSATTFDDTLRTTGSHQYRVQARGDNGVWSAFTDCNPPLTAGGGGGPVAAPASCSAAVVGGSGEITWAASPNATDYRVFRSVDGGNTFWRGLVQGTTFTDSLRSGQSHVYSVQARGADGVWSDSTICAPPIIG